MTPLTYPRVRAREERECRERVRNQAGRTGEEETGARCISRTTTGGRILLGEGRPPCRRREQERLEQLERREQHQYIDDVLENRELILRQVGPGGGGGAEEGEKEEGEGSLLKGANPVLIEWCHRTTQPSLRDHINQVLDVE